MNWGAALSSRSNGGGCMSEQLACPYAMPAVMCGVAALEEIDGEMYLRNMNQPLRAKHQRLRRVLDAQI
jgi:hypothetical protein